MYGSKNSVEDIQRAVNTDLSGPTEPVQIANEAKSQGDGYPKNEPAKAVSAKDHVPEEIKPAIEAPKELSPAVDSSTSKEKLTKIITDKEKEQMTSQKFSFDELYKMALKEQTEPGLEAPMALGGDMSMGGEAEAGEEGGDEITVTLSREAAQALCDVLTSALGNGEMEGEEESEGGEMEQEGDDLEEATEMSKIKDAASGAHDAKNQKVADPTTLNKGLDFQKANIDPHKNVKGIKKPQELKHKVDKA